MEGRFTKPVTFPQPGTRAPEPATRAAPDAEPRTGRAFKTTLLAQETLDEHQILEVTGLPPAPTLETGHVAMPSEPRHRVHTH